MLVTALATANANDYLSERFRTAYEFLSRPDLAELPLGRNEIDGEDVYANVLQYDTVPEHDDFCLLKTPEPVSSIALHAGELAIFAPEDAHKPGCTLSEPAHVRKIVVKVRA